MTASESTSHIRPILRLRSSGISRSARQTSASGWIPMLRSAATECWVGFVLRSPDGAGDPGRDLVGDVRDDLHGVAEVLAAALLGDHLGVDLAGGDVGLAVEV